jgi:CheY-like chemotaxis protein
VLLVEDDPAAVALTTRVLGDAPASIELTPVGTGEDALAFLHREAGFERAPRPDLMLLDLDLPGISGIDVLRRMRADHALAGVPVAALTADHGDEELATCAALRVQECLPMPLELRAFTSVLEYVSEFG